MNIKRAIGAALAILAVTGAADKAVADIPVAGFGGHNFNLGASTTFVADLSDGSTGLSSSMNASLWFETAGFKNRGLASDESGGFSISLDLTNSAFFSWRGYTLVGNNSALPSYVSGDQIIGLWFDDLAAELRYQDFWIRFSGLKPELTVDQASLRSVFDNVIKNRTAEDKNSLPLPLFNGGGTWYSGGIVSVIGRDLVYLDKDDVDLYGMYSAGYQAGDLNGIVKVGSWKNGADNDANSWVFGAEGSLPAGLAASLSLSALGAINYQTTAAGAKIQENPLALGAAFDYRWSLPLRMVLKTFIGADVFLPTTSAPTFADLDWETGGGLLLYFRGTGAQFKRNSSYGGTKLGDTNAEVGLFFSANINQDKEMNLMISANEDPKASLLKKIGGFFQLEGMNLLAANGKPALFAAVGQLEYLAIDNCVAYLYEKYLPGYTSVGSATGTGAFTSKVGVKITPVDNLTVDCWYERSDTINANGSVNLSAGSVSTAFGITL